MQKEAENGMKGSYLRALVKPVNCYSYMAVVEDVYSHPETIKGSNANGINSAHRDGTNTYGGKLHVHYVSLYSTKAAEEKAFLEAHLEFELPILKRYPEGKHPNTVEKLKEKSANIYSIYPHTASIAVCTNMVANTRAFGRLLMRISTQDQISPRHTCK